MNVRTTAFVPVRGGSKSIPLKNIKFLCGKPLVCWVIAAIEQVPLVDEIIVATDSEQIAAVVTRSNFTKTKIYRRLQENATDTASTESVMLEYISQSNLADDDIFMLVQATSPLTEAVHIAEALELYKRNNYDSLLSCVRNYRFFWDENGTSKNYNYKERPRRQDFPGQLMENGALYINTAGGIKRSQNRLSGKIGIYEMPEWTATEIDEPDDWIILEQLMRKHILSRRIGKRIKLFLTDVDGVLTDGGMYYSEKGDELKKFNARDGMAFELLRKAGIKTGIITSESTRMVENRAKKIKADHLAQGKRGGGKLAAAIEICNETGISLEETAYIGDDVNCKELLYAVGLPACPADAMPELKNTPNIICLSSRGGDGCVREFAEMLLKPDDKNGCSAGDIYI